MIGLERVPEFNPASLLHSLSVELTNDPASLLANVRAANSGTVVRAETATSHLVAAVLCDEPSTRTRISAEAALGREGVHVVSVYDAAQLSISKGESWPDTARILGLAVDALFVRSRICGLPSLLALHSGVPVVNLGDGLGEHPTQGLASVAHVFEHFGQLSRLRCLFAGDGLRARTIHSTARFFDRWGISCSIAIDAPNMTDEAPQWWESRPGLRILSSAEARAEEFDIVYLTRAQAERGSDGQDPFSWKEVQQCVTTDGLVLHPLPRGPELPDSAFNDRRVKVWRHVELTSSVRRWVVHSLVHSRIEWQSHPPMLSNLCTRPDCVGSLVADSRPPTAGSLCDSCYRRI